MSPSPSLGPDIMHLILSNEHGLAFLPGRWSELEWGEGGVRSSYSSPSSSGCCSPHIAGAVYVFTYWETGGQNGKARTGKILPGDGESGGPRVRVGLSFVTLGKVPKFLGPQFPLQQFSLVRRITPPSYQDPLTDRFSPFGAIWTRASSPALFRGD